MAEPTRRHGLFPALLRHWRHHRGLSQLDLALAADVSSRHVSFLETGRSSPSAEMVLRLAATLDVPLRHVNAMLDASGHPPVYEDLGADDPLPTPIRAALDTMMHHHDPLPLLVVDRSYDVVALNHGAAAVLGAAAGGSLDPTRPNLVRLTFGEARPAIVNADEVCRALLWRLQREVLAEPDDGPLRDLLDEVLASPGVADDWREVDLSVPSPPALVVHLRVAGRDLRFLTTITAFQAPQAVVVDELRIETWFPVDDTTGTACAALVASSTR